MFSTGEFLDFLFGWGVFAWLACAVFAGYLGDTKGGWGLWWLFMGFLFGPISLIAAAGLPDKNLSKRLLPSPKTHVTCPDCSEFVHKKANKCPSCGVKLIPHKGLLTRFTG